MNDLKARIFNIQKYSLYDGPGIRTLVFFKGCPLHCTWCSNPESLNPNTEIMFIESLCTGCGNCVEVCPQKIHSMIRDDNGLKHNVDRSVVCSGCGLCEARCPARALSVCGKLMTIDHVMDAILQDEMFYRTSGGGVTLGGGEVTMQTEFATELLGRCKDVGINTAIETCGYSSWKNISRFLPVTDLFLYDMKAFYSSVHKRVTGRGNEIILSNMRALLDAGANLTIRIPLVKGYNDDSEMLLDFVEFVKSLDRKPNGIDILPYHRLGVGKYSEIDHNYEIKGNPSMSDDDLDAVVSMLELTNLPVKVIRH